jgi:hypothetical protein
MIPQYASTEVSGVPLCRNIQYSELDRQGAGRGGPIVNFGPPL